MENEVKKFFNNAITKLKEANHELNRPEEDVVSWLVCQNAQHAIENYLKGYLLKNNIDPSGFDTIERLYHECLKLNKAFERVDLNNFTCSYAREDMAFCNDFNKISHCFSLADGLDTFLRKERIIG